MKKLKEDGKTSSFFKKYMLQLDTRSKQGGVSMKKDYGRVVRMDQEDWEYFNNMKKELRLSSVAAAVNYVLNSYKKYKGVK